MRGADMEYKYDPELPKPKALNVIDFANPALAPVIKMLAGNMRRAVRGWMPPEDLRFRAVGSEPECFAVEPESDETLPGMVFCHGGGFFLPLQTSALELAAVYAKELHIRVFLPEYRLLPEHPAPSALYDCLAVWERVTALPEVDARRCLLYGESAGGALAAGIALLLRDAGETGPLGQALIYPTLDDRAELYASASAYPNAVWSRRSNDYMWSSYLKERPPELEKYLVPAKRSDLSGLPPAYVEPQGIDILRDEAVRYAERLRDSGVDTELNVIEGSYHGFDSDPGNPFVRRVLEHRLKFFYHCLSKERTP